jgi:hypothetical protein
MIISTSHQKRLEKNWNLENNPYKPCTSDVYFYKPSKAPKEKLEFGK